MINVLLFQGGMKRVYSIKSEIFVNVSFGGCQRTSGDMCRSDWVRAPRLFSINYLNLLFRDAADNRQFECFALIRLDHQDDPQSEAQQTHERRQHDQKRD